MPARCPSRRAGSHLRLAGYRRRARNAARRDEEIAKMWPRFRGPGGLGISAYTNVPETWDAKSGKGIVWKTPVPLPGNNSPVVWGKRVFLSGADQRRREVYCFDADSGKLLWQQAAPGTPQSTARPPKVNDDTGYAAPTTATDGRRVFAIFANGDLAAFDFSGKLAWSKSLGIPENSYGHASSLAMYKNLLLVQFDQGSSRTPKSKLLAFDSATGKIVWQVDRPVPNSWASPIVIRHADREQIITAADPWVIAYNPADGAEIWRAKCLRTDIGPSPTFADGRVFVANDNCVLSAIRADGRGDVTATHVLWKGEDGMPDTCSPLATKEFVFLLTSFGTLTCYDAVKGDVLWAEDFEHRFRGLAEPGGQSPVPDRQDGQGVDRRTQPREVQAHRRGRPGRRVRHQPRVSGRTHLPARKNAFVLHRQVAACRVWFMECQKTKVAIAGS